MLNRRRFLAWLAATSLANPTLSPRARAAGSESPMGVNSDGREAVITLFLCGDVMSGRAIDQILPNHNRPQIHEPYLVDARDYIALAERVNGPIPRPVAFDYVWGDALAELSRMSPDARIVNLETAITTHDVFEPKGINYRMHPANVGLLGVAGIDCCALANNHVLDWGDKGLADTLACLQGAEVRTAGAGRDLARAQAPAVIPIPGKGRVLVFAFGSEYSGIARDWAATQKRPGIDLLPDLSAATLAGIAERVGRTKQTGDIAVASVHWGGNWDYQIPAAQRRFAHGLIDQAGIDLVHGHSSHHVKGVEVYRGRPIIYGCGDFLNDYEGIRGHEEYRADLGLMYFPTLDIESGRLVRFELTATRIKRFRIQRADPAEAAWLAAVLDREGRPLGTGVVAVDGARLRLEWARR